jgi:hypothetical protein
MYSPAVFVTTGTSLLAGGILSYPRHKGKGASGMLNRIKKKERK